MTAELCRSILCSLSLTSSFITPNLPSMTLACVAIKYVSRTTNSVPRDAKTGQQKRPLFTSSDQSHPGTINLINGPRFLSNAAIKLLSQLHVSWSHLLRVLFMLEVFNLLHPLYCYLDGLAEAWRPIVAIRNQHFFQGDTCFKPVHDSSPFRSFFHLTNH